MGSVLEFKNVMLLLWISIGIIIVVVAIILILKFIKKDNAMVSIEKNLKQKNFSKALTLAQKYMQEKPDDYMLKYSIAQAYEGLGEQEDAISNYEKASIAASMNGEAAITVQINLKVASLFSKAGKPKEALGYYVMVLEKQPKHSKALFEAGEIFYEMGNLKKAKEYLDILVKIKPDNLRAKFLLSKINYKLGDMNGCITHLQELTKALPKTDPMFKEASILLSDVYSNLKRYDDSVQVLNPLLNDKDMFQKVLLKIISILIRANKFQQAIDLANRYMVRLTDDVKAQALYQIASAYFKYGEVYKALKLWEEAYRLKRDFMDLKDIIEKYNVILSNPKMENYYTRNDRMFQEFAIAMLKIKFSHNTIKQERYWVLSTSDTSHVVYRLPYPVSSIDLDDIERHVKGDMSANYNINLYTLFGFAKECQNHYLYRKVNEFSGDKLVTLVNQA